MLDPFSWPKLLRNLKYLITIDSAPIHLAASTDINIIGIFTVIHPEYLLPYRRDPNNIISQEYNTWVVPNKARCAYCSDKIYEAMPIDKCVLNTYECIPTSDMIIDTWKRAAKC